MPCEKYYSHTARQEFKLWWNADQLAYPEGGACMHPNNIDYEKVDKSLRPLVKKINKTKIISSFMCCEGHVDKDEYGTNHVEIWLRIHTAEGLKIFFEWVEESNKTKIELGGYSKENLIRVEFLGATRNGYYFVLYGDFINTVENKRIIKALNKAWPL